MKQARARFLSPSFKKDAKLRSGQAMLIAVLALGSAILGATTVAGILTLYQLRATTNAEYSAKALFAADAGVEWTLASYYCGKTGRTPCPPEAPTFSASGASVTTTCYNAQEKPSGCGDTSTTVSAVSIGSAGNTKRAFLVTLQGATSTMP